MTFEQRLAGSEAGHVDRRDGQPRCGAEVPGVEWACCVGGRAGGQDGRGGASGARGGGGGGEAHGVRGQGTADVRACGYYPEEDRKDIVKRGRSAFSLFLILISQCKTCDHVIV